VAYQNGSNRASEAFSASIVFSKLPVFNAVKKFDPPSRHQQNKEIKQKRPLEIGEAIESPSGERDYNAQTS
jgi:hypothetical protein